MQIISRREHHEQRVYERKFDYVGHKDWGFGFPCDEHGVIDVAGLHPCGQDSLRQCLTGVINGKPVVDRGIVSWLTRWTDPAIGLCDVCGDRVVLKGFTCTCDKCGADYNMSGQRLAPREQWGEETGEHWADVVNGL